MDSPIPSPALVQQANEKRDSKNRRSRVIAPHPGTNGPPINTFPYTKHSIVVVMDTSASMNMKNVEGLSILDCAKSFVEKLIQARSRDPNRHDVFMLIEARDPAPVIRTTFSDPIKSFLYALKSLKGSSTTSLGPALMIAMEFMNCTRLLNNQTENYAQGRYMGVPFLEPVSIIVLTDGVGNGVTPTCGMRRIDSPKKGQSGDPSMEKPNFEEWYSPDIQCSASSRVPGFELNRSRLRWDQKVYGLVFAQSFELSGSNPIDNGLELGNIAGCTILTETGLGKWCEESGGKPYLIKSMKEIVRVAEEIAERTVAEVCVIFDAVGAGSCRTFLKQISRGAGAFTLWPLPETYHSDQATTSLPARDAHPTIGYWPAQVETHIPPWLPVDVYEVASCAMTRSLLSTTLVHGSGWQTFVNVRQKGSDIDVRLPFGFLSANSARSAVNLVVLPYNYVDVVSLIEQSAQPGFKPSNQWHHSLERYLSRIPKYYLRPLRNAFKVMGMEGVVSLIPDQGLPLPPGPLAFLRGLKQRAISELDRIQKSYCIDRVPVRRGHELNTDRLSKDTSRQGSSTIRSLFGGQKPNSSRAKPEPLKERPNTEYHESKPEKVSFSVDSRTDLIRAVSEWKRVSVGNDFYTGATRKILGNPNVDKEHSLPVPDMGDYQKVLDMNSKIRLRSVNDEEEWAALHPHFGNPWRRPGKRRKRPRLGSSDSTSSSQASMVERQDV